MERTTSYDAHGRPLTLLDPNGLTTTLSYFPRGWLKSKTIGTETTTYSYDNVGQLKLPWQKLKMAMAVRSKNSHYRFTEIRRKHWNAVAKNNAVSTDFEPVIRHFVDITPSVIDAIAARLPRGFPVQISEAVFAGIRAQIKRLEIE